MSSSAPRRQPVSEASPFSYADAESPRGTADNAAAGQSAEDRIRQQLDAAFKEGRQSAEQELRCELDATLAKKREQTGEALRAFALERQDYYRRIEGEVVELALAIARKILHRETQLDPNALAGIVHVTLQKLDTGTKVKVHVHPQQAADWRHYFACRMDDAPPPDVHEDPAIAFGECRIETSLGSTEIGFDSQLKEIETGLLDLLAERPSAQAPPSPAEAPDSLSPSSTAEAR